MTKKTNYSVKNNYDYLKRRKPVIPKIRESFKPDKEVKEYLDCMKANKINKSDKINKAIKLFIKYEYKKLELLDELSLKFPFLWRRINRRNGQFITQKIKCQKQK